MPRGARAGRRRQSARGADVHGVLLVDKPAGLTSAEVVRRLKAKVGGKVGHLGTLDPFATGLLPMCLGEATKIAQFLNASDKEYEGTIALGVATDTGDLTGELRHERPVPGLTDADLDGVVAAFSGPLMQTPPMYSAIKRAGVPLYKLARQGIEIEREPRPISIHDLSLTRCDHSHLGFRVSCSKGTYIRVLAEDIGTALGTVAHLKSLRRTGFGDFRLEQGAVDPLRWDPDTGGMPLSIRDALGDMPIVSLPRRAVDAVRRGQPWVLREFGPRQAGPGRALFVGETGAAVAVVECDSGRWRFARVLKSDLSLQDEGTVVAPAG